MNKTAITLGALLFGSMMIFPVIAAHSAKQAIVTENQNKTWAPMVAYRAGNMTMRSSRYDMGRKTAGQTVKTITNENRMGDANYQSASYAEKSGHSENAVDRYNLLMKKMVLLASL